MMKVPFGMRKSTHEYVAVDEVSSGKTCDCVCPSCQLPLIAKQGKVKDWHFAHDTRSTNDEIDACEFSYQESLRVMIKQLLSKDKSLCIPDYPIPHKLNLERKCITRAKRIQFDEVQLDQTISEVHGVLDAVLKLNDYPMGIYITYRGRSAPCFEKLNYLKGLVLLEIDNLRLSRIDTTYIEQLSHFLTDSQDHKRWLYHERQGQVIAQFENEAATLSEEALWPYYLDQAKEDLHKKGIHTGSLGWDGLLVLTAERLMKE